KKGNHQLNSKHEGSRSFLNGCRQLVGVPSNPCGERLGFKMIMQRCQVPPGDIPAQELHASRLKHELEEEPAQQPQADARRFAFWPQVWAPMHRRREKDAQKTGLEKQNVPLKAEKLAAY